MQCSPLVESFITLSVMTTALLGVLTIIFVCAAVFSELRIKRAVLRKIKNGEKVF